MQNNIPAKPYDPFDRKPLNAHESTFTVACLSWCTAKQKITPILIKYIGEDQAIYTIKDIRVITYPPENHFPYKEYLCEAAIGGILREFRLRYFHGESKWTMSL